MTEIRFHQDHSTFSWENAQQPVDWLKHIIRKYQVQAKSLNIIYCSDDRLLNINRQFLDHDYYTDIITFDLSDSDHLEGEIYISVDRVRENAQDMHIQFETELCRVMAHGLLHLIGYKDKTDEEKKVMRSEEDACLSLLPEVPRGTF